MTRSAAAGPERGPRPPARRARPRRTWPRFALCFGLGALLGASPATGQDANPQQHRNAYRKYEQALAERDLQSALIYARKAFEFARDELGPRHARTGILAYNLGSVQLRLEHERDAVAALQQAVAIYRVVYGDDAAQLIGPTEKLGHAHQSLGQWDAAERTYSNALRLIELNTPDDHAAIETMLLRLTGVAEALDSHNRVRAYALRAIRAMESGQDPRPVELGMIHLRLARNEFTRGGDGRLALKHMEVAAPLYEENLEPDDPELIPYYEFMAQAYGLVEKKSTARKYQRKLEKSRKLAGDAQ